MSQASSKQYANVDFDALELCADLAIPGKQNVDYWKSTPIPRDPNQATRREGILRVVVFLPLAMVLLGWSYLGYTWGLGVFFALALPLMVALHNSVHRSLLAQLAAASDLDRGRYSAVMYLSKKLGLVPEQITWELVMGQAEVYEKLMRMVRADLQAKQAMKSTAPVASAATASAACHLPPDYGSCINRLTANVASAATSDAIGHVADIPALNAAVMSTPQFNPANGLPMMNDLVDIHGNTTGTTNVEDMFGDLDEMTHSTSHSFDNFATPALDMGSFGGGQGYGFD